ncbi:MAG TPA: IclR family transcriptional regulator C-terminal domain-containing protein [Alphaproteobacteria bacterium]|nr:IclR family transcriptional regulator C-terminal domain-containing protein [Alphaproteobacteria bacterium]
MFGLKRGLAVLRALNNHNDATVLEISRATALPRPTVYRLLATLQEEGYVDRGPNGNTFRLTIAVRGLAWGYDDEAWVGEIAAPVLQDLLRQVVWPSDIATYERGAMLIRETTNTTSPLAMLPERAGHRPPVLTSSLGRAYLSFSDKRERESILAVLSARGHRERLHARDRAAVDRMVQATRARGYAIREGGRAPGTTSIAVPVMNNGEVLAAINIICVASAISLEEIVGRYLEPMRQAARQIERALGNSGA